MVQYFDSACCKNSDSRLSDDGKVVVLTKKVPT